MLGLSPSGPPAEPLGKVQMAFATAASEKKWERSNSAGGDGIWDSECDGGCFCLRAARVLSLLSATESSEQARQTAPLRSPPLAWRQQVVQGFPFGAGLLGTYGGLGEVIGVGEGPIPS